MTTELNNVVIRFSGDSGDGMQLTGTLFSNLSAILGNEISTFPDFPAEIRAPQGTLGGVSGFQVHIGKSQIFTPGDECDILVAMNPAALKVNAAGIKKGGVVLFDDDSFTKADLEKAAFVTDNPFEELNLSDSIQLFPVPLTSMTKESLVAFEMDNKSVVRSKNMFALGLICWLFNEPVDKAVHFLEEKFKKKQEVLRANVKVLTDGYNYGNNLHLSISTYHIDRSHELEHGKYTSINGNKATAWGLIAAAESAGVQLFLGSYPITPATDIMHELAARKDVGVKVIQMEDEIGSICSALGASFAGCLAVTNTSGPGLSLMSEALGLAVITELPLVVIDVMRSGPSTGLPTKTEQTDLMQALYGRNGESPLVVMAAGTPSNCFHYTYMAAKIALEHTTPVLLLTDAFIANGSSLWKLPKLAELPAIKPSYAPKDTESFKSVMRDNQTLARYLATPSTEGLEHRIGSLEKDCETGCVSINPENHEKMIGIRQQKIENVANFIPKLEIEGDPDAEILVVGWGSTYGHLLSAVNQLNNAEKKIALVQFYYISPLPRNTEEILRRYKKIVVCELNSGMFAAYLRSKFSGISISQYNKIQGQPFKVSELVEQLTNNYE